MASLADKSVIGWEGGDDEPRVVMLETIREFGLEQLAASGEEEAVRERHAAYFLELAVQAEPELIGADVGAWLDRLDADHANLRTALDWFGGRADWDAVIQFGAAIWRFWSARERQHEGRDWLERAFAETGGDTDPVRLEGLIAAGALAEDLGDIGRATAHYERALATAREAGDARTVARALDNLGNIAHDQGELDRASELHEEGLRWARQAGDRRIISATLNNLGTVALYGGNAVLAERYYTESLTVARDRGDLFQECLVLGNLGLALNRTAPDRAIPVHEEALRRSRELEVPRGVAASLLALAEAAIRQGDRDRAGPLLAEALEIGRGQDDRLVLGAALFNLAELAHDSGDPALSWEQGRTSLLHFHALGRKGELADCLEFLGGLAVGAGLLEDATRLLGNASAVREGTGTASKNESEVTHAIEAARAGMAAQAFTAAWDEGQTLTLDQAVASIEALTGPFLAAVGREPQPLVSTDPSLTPRERAVLGLVAEGRTDREIAVIHGTSARTISAHVGQILTKLGRSNAGCGGGDRGPPGAHMTTRPVPPLAFQGSDNAVRWWLGNYLIRFQHIANMRFWNAPGMGDR